MLALLKSCVVPLALIIDGMILALPNNDADPLHVSNHLCECEKFLGSVWNVLGEPQSGVPCVFCGRVYGGHAE